MKIAVVSDIHGDIRIINKLVEDRGKYEILLVCGDTCQFGTEYELDEMFFYLSSIGRQVFLIAGNHCCALEKKSFVRKMKKKYPNITYIIDEYVKYKDITIYGTPYSHYVGNWSFGVEDSEFASHLPDKPCDILMTHNPPCHRDLSCFPTKLGIRDVGFTEFADFLNESHIRYNFHGHVHECGGGVVDFNGTKSMNVSNGVNYVEI